MHRIGMTEAAETWIGEQTPEALDLFNPIYLPMIVEPRPWTSLSEGGYLVTPMKLFKRQTGKRAQQRLQKADLSAVYAAVNALQNTPYRINEAVYRFQQDAWAAGLPFFGLTSEDQRKGLEKMMAFRFGQAARLCGEERFYFPCQVDHRGRVYRTATDESTVGPYRTGADRVCRRQAAGQQPRRVLAGDPPRQLLLEEESVL